MQEIEGILLAKRKTSFNSNSIRLWNHLFADAQECEDVDTFVTKLKQITVK